MIKFAIENPVKVIVGVFFIFVFGMQALFTMPYRLIPTIENPQITVRTSWSGASPYEMEKEVVDRQERVLKTIPGLIDFESSASNDSASITLLFGLDTNINDAILLVSNKLNEVRGYPDDVDRPTIRSTNSDNTPVVELTLVTTPENKRSIDEYASYFEEVIKPYLDRVQGVADLSYYGGNSKQLQIKVNPHTISLYNITLSDISDALNRENIDISAGNTSFGVKDYRFRTLGEARSPKDIREIVVISGDNSRVKMGDIAEIDFGYAKPSGVVRYGETESINVGIIAQAGADVLQLTNDVEEVVTNLNNGILNDNGLEIIWLTDQRGYILNAIALVKSNIFEGGILAIIILLLFLRSFRSTLVIATTIPICVIGTFFVMKLFGRSLNVISLAGIAFSVGMLIDNSIVVLENIDRHLKEGKNAFKAALEGTKEVWGAILASTLTNVAVFLPVLFIKEEAGQLFGDIALAMSASAALSLTTSMAVIPVFTKLLYSRSPQKEGNRIYDRFLNKIGSTVVHWIMLGSDNINKSFVNKMIIVVSFTSISVASAYFLMPRMDYLPLGNKNLMESRIQVPSGSDVEYRRELGDFVYEELKDYIGKENDGYPAIKTLVYVGWGSYVRISLTAEDEMRAGELQPLLSKLIAKVPGVTASTSQSPLFNIGRGSSNMFMMNVSGAMEYDNLTAITKVIENRVRKEIPSAQVRVNPSTTPTYPEIHVIPDREALKAAGISANELGISVDAYLDGRKIGEFKDPVVGTIDISLQGMTNTMESPDEVYSILVASGNSRPVPISNISTVQETVGVDRIRRYNSQRAFNVMITMPKGMVLEEMKEAINTKVIAPLKSEGVLEGISITTSGASSKLDDAKNALLGNFVFATLITYLLMAALLNNFLYPFIILFSVPLAASGGFLGLYVVNTFIAEQALDIITMLGFIMLVGTVVNNPILIVYQAINNMNYGMNGHNAIRESLQSRIRPIFMSTATTLFGMLPLVVAPGAGSELYRGLGAVMLGGLFLSTVFTLFLIPALLSLFIGSKTGTGVQS